VKEEEDPTTTENTPIVVIVNLTGKVSVSRSHDISGPEYLVPQTQGDTSQVLE
jgi:hypothetical protein